MRLLPALLLASLQGGPSRGVASAFAPRLVTAALAPSRAGGDRTRLFGKCRRAQMGVVLRVLEIQKKGLKFSYLSFFWIFLSNSFLLFSLHIQFAEPRKTQNAATGGAMSDDEKAIRDCLTSGHSWASFGDATFADWLCRPSGNPISGEGLKEMMSSGDITGSKSKLREVKILDVEGNMAYAVCVCEASFEYKGTPNDDVYVMTNVLRKVGGKWRVVWAHRSTGRKPDEEAPGPWP